MKDTFSVLFWVNKHKISKNTSKAPIFTRITVNGKRAELSTGKSVENDHRVVPGGKPNGCEQQEKPPLDRG